MPAVPIDQLKHREAWTFAEAGAVWGYGAAYFRDLYKRGEIDGFRSGKKNQRVKLFASSVRAYFERKRIESLPVAQPAKKLTAKQWAIAEGLVS